MQLYKSRNFSDFFTDTFTFLKLNWKHFFKHYFIINGALLLVLAAITYVFSQFFFKDLFNPQSLHDTTRDFDFLVSDNPGLFFLLLIALVLTALLFGIISYAYTPLYFKLYEKHGGANFITKDIIASYKTNFTKLIVFVLLSIVLTFLLIIPFGIVGFILTITIIGILLLPLLIGLYAGLFNGTLLEYLDDKRSYFESFGYTWNLITSKFWAAVGCIGIFYAMSYIIQMSISVFQSIFGIGTTIFDSSPKTNFDEISLIVIIFYVITYIISFFVSIVLNCIVQVNQSIVYYGTKEDKEQINTVSDIDLIGSSEA